jgi:23S rRNA (uridine2552-2'-O)-methyltransferase
MTRFIPKDHYFDKAKAQGFKARSIFKLEEIDKSLRLIKSDSVVLDLGCAPGSWLQYLAKRLSKKGAALGVDLTQVNEKLHGRIKTVVDDCFTLTKDKVAHYLTDLCPNFNGLDVVLSDMAPKTSGIKHVDQIRSIELARAALGLAEQLLKPGGHVVIKVFASGEVNELLLQMKSMFSTVKQMRPKSIRAPSKEFYVVGLNKK